MTFVRNAFNPHANNNRALHIAVNKKVRQDLAKEEGIKDFKNPLKKAFQYATGMRSIMVCTQCHRGMDGKFGQKQIDNNREFAPICIPCCMGTHRVPLALAKQRINAVRKGFKEETKEKFNKHK